MALSSRPRAGGATVPWRVIGLACVAALIVLNIVLIMLLITRDDDAPVGQVPGPIPTFGSAPTPSPIPVPSATIAPVTASPRYFDAVNASEMWRADSGDCATGGLALEQSVDGGQSWRAVAVTGVDVRQVVQLDSIGNATVRLLARTGGDCALGSYVSYTDGEFWAADPAAGADLVYLNPGVTVGQEQVASPCEPLVQVQASDEGNIVAACPGMLAERLEGSSDWTSLEVQNLLAVVPRGGGYTIAVSGAAGCEGISILSVTSPVGSAAPAVVGCDASETEPSEVTLAQYEGTLWLWSGDRLAVSVDAGATWN